MYVKIRNSANEPDIIVNVSKMSTIGELRRIIKDQHVHANKLTLLYRGKVLIDSHKIIDYNIKLNDVIQLVVNKEVCVKSNIKPKPVVSDKVLPKAVSKYYIIGDPIDALHSGAWYEAQIVEILRKPDSETTDENNQEPNILFRIKWDCEENDDVVDLSFNEIRPRARYTYRREELSEGQTVFVNYNVEDDQIRGDWYDFIICESEARKIKGTIILAGTDIKIMEGCTIKFIDEVMRIEKPLLLTSRPENYISNLPPIRKIKYYCEICEDVSSKLCKDCGCSICGGKNDPKTILLCDDCNCGFHTKCLKPPLHEVPPKDEDWYCPSCKTDTNEIVKAGEKLKFSNKKAKMPSAKQDSNARDWGRGMACVGRTKECTIVPKNYFGPIPGIEVGTTWMFRVQVSESGVHRAPVGGIHGRESDGAYSIVLSGGYEDDVDNGLEFIYTGSGGRDLSGNKRSNRQSSDQTLTKLNKALALNCNAPLNENGNEAVDWKSGRPVRVVRNYKSSKHSKYGPKQGNRYDGIYKVVKYYPEKGKSGFMVWKYLLRRDDPEPAPWEEGGQELEMLYPPGYLEASSCKPSHKRKQSQSTISEDEKPSTSRKQQKKATVVTYTLNEKIQEAIENDEINEKLWEGCKTYLEEGKRIFLSKVEESFMCICCQEVVYHPVTLECKHNVCKECLQRSFTAKIYNCPHCRFELGKDFNIVVNKELSYVLLNLFPGYDASR